MKKAFYVILGLGITTTVIASTLLADNITYTPNDKNWNVNNVSDSLDYLKENNGKIVYKGMTISYDKTTNQLKYYYNNKEIYPIYWYGYKGNMFGDFATWREANVSSSYSLESDYLATTYSITYASYCYAVVATNYMINLKDFNSYHVIVKDNTIAGSYMQYVKNIGNLGNNWSANENGYGTKIEEASNNNEYVTDISNIKDSYYVGFTNRCAAGNLNISAMWLEK